MTSTIHTLLTAALLVPFFAVALLVLIAIFGIAWKGSKS